jgi:hypothetical protein
MPTTKQSSPTRFAGSPSALCRPIGRITVPAGDVHYASYETASWWHDIEYPAQTVTLWSNGYYAKWTVTGKVTDSYFGPHGHPIEPGTERTHTRTPYDYDFFAQVHDDKLPDGYVVELLPEYTTSVDERPIGEGERVRLVRFGRLMVTEHPLICTRVTNRDNRLIDGQSWNEEHAYDVYVRGVKVGELLIHVNRGFNGDTSDAAYRLGSELLLPA